MLMRISRLLSATSSRRYAHYKKCRRKVHRKMKWMKKRERVRVSTKRTIITVSVTAMPKTGRPLVASFPCRWRVLKVKLKVK